MFAQTYRFFLIICIFLVASCAHPIHKDFDVYLKEHPTALEKINQRVGYTIDEGTKNLVYEFRSFTTGIANKWVINVGEMLQSYLDTIVKNAFEELNSVGDTSSKDYPIVINFRINSYKFEDFQAKVGMKISTFKQGTILFEKSYYAEGKEQAGKMFWGGVFAQRHSVHQSTQLAFDSIITNFLSDFKTYVKD